MRLAVLILTFALGSTLGSGVAWAFDCNGVTKPSSIVICSDPDLMRVADERQDAVNEARARLTDEQFRALMADQAAWVRTYATACGVSPEGSPPRLPVSSAIKACFGRAGAARTAYIRSYGLPALSPPAGTQARIGPGFDCGNAVRPVALMICADADLSRVDLRFNQAYSALFHQLEQAGRQELREEDIAFIDAAQNECGVPLAGGLTTQVWQARNCIKSAYDGQRVRWIARLSGPAFEEATRPAERHLELQRSLGILGFLPRPSELMGFTAQQRAPRLWLGRPGAAGQLPALSARPMPVLSSERPCAGSIPLPPRDLRHPARKTRYRCRAGKGYSWFPA